MYTEALSAGFVPRFQDTSVETRFIMAGVQIIPRAEIDAHKRDYAESSRVGVWKKYSFLPRAYVLIGDHAAGYLGAVFMITMIVLGAGIGSSLGDILILPVIGAFMGLLIGTVLLTLLSTAMFRLWIHSRHYRDFVASGSYWRKEWYTFDDLREITRLPANVRRKIDKLRQEFQGEDAKIFIETFGRDPLMGLQTDRKDFYFGAWDTGNSSLERY